MVQLTIQTDSRVIVGVAGNNMVGVVVRLMVGATVTMSWDTQRCIALVAAADGAVAGAAEVTEVSEVGV